MSEDGTSGSSADGDKILVAEYVLGLLDAVEHDRVAQRIAAEPALAAELRLWQLRLQSLDTQFAEAQPPSRVMKKLEARLFGNGRAAASLWDSLILWRGLAAAGVAVAVVAIGFSALQPRLDVDGVATQLVAALQAQEGSGVQFVAFYDTASKAVRLIGLEGQAVPDKDFELWYIKGDEAAVSMGVIPVDQRIEIRLDPVAQSKIGEGTVLAVTLEPKGGSPTGVATGPIVAVGKATAI